LATSQPRNPAGSNEAPRPAGRRRVPPPPREPASCIRELTRLQLPAPARAAADQLALALRKQVSERPGTAPPAGGEIAAAVADLREVASALDLAVARVDAGGELDARGLRGIRRELLEVIHALARLAAAEEEGLQADVPRTRHLRAAGWQGSPPTGALDLERLLEILVRRRRRGDSRAGLPRRELLRGAAQDLRTAAALLHRLEPRPAGRVIAQLAALATDLDRFARGPAARSKP
jgi:hypothetical protein